MNILWLLLIPQICFGYAMYGTKRYGRSDPRANPSWVPLPVYRSQPEYGHSPAAYYSPVVYPITQEYSDDYYYPTKPMIHYPPYAVVRPIHKLDMYQGYPHYYTADRERPIYNLYGDYDASEPIENLHDEMIQEDAREEREDSLPIGQETWFEDEANSPKWKSPTYDDVNAAFLQNLILSEMYKDSLAKGELNGDGKKGDIFFDESDNEQETDIYGDRDTRDFEDVDVRELKALAGKPLYHVAKTNKIYPNSYDSGDYGTVKTIPTQQPHLKPIPDMESKHYYDDQKYFNEDYPNDDAWINWGSKRSAEIKQTKQSTPKKVTLENSKTNKKPLRWTSTISPSTTTLKATEVKLVKDGQDEVALLRPAVPVRRPYAEPVMKMLATETTQNKRSPSVYDTIKHMLAMEAEMQKNGNGESRLRKRYVATEGDLVGELRGLKSRNRA